MHERESYEVLLTILKKRKKVTFCKTTNKPNKRPRLQCPKMNEEAKEDTTEVPDIWEAPKEGEVWPKLSQEPTDSLSVLADAALTTSKST